ncbi:MAG: hypothetical protein IKI51_00915, partial [Clostridia bacterium]|nr:hypothetical protein [Clostridia bacterium]
SAENEVTQKLAIESFFAFFINSPPIADILTFSREFVKGEFIFHPSFSVEERTTGGRPTVIVRSARKAFDAATSSLGRFASFSFGKRQICHIICRPCIYIP